MFDVPAQNPLLTGKPDQVPKTNPPVHEGPTGTSEQEVVTT